MTRAWAIHLHEAFVRIAHLTDLHLLERCFASRSAFALGRLNLLSAFSALDCDGRRQRALDALRGARRVGADHVVITGDLTEDGVEAQFEMLAEVLDECPFAPERVTLVPGNHDAYDDSTAFARALRGPLRPYAPTSTPGTVTALHDRTLLCPVSTVRPSQTVLSATGLSRHDDVERIDHLAATLGPKSHTVVIAQHHAPLPFRNPVRERLEGLRNPRALQNLIERRANVHLVHGHVHARSDARVEPERPSQVFCAEAVRDDAQAFRLYEAGFGDLHPLPQPVDVGSLTPGVVDAPDSWSATTRPAPMAPIAAGAPG